MPDTEGPDKKVPREREFMREKIVKRPLTKKQIDAFLAAGILCLPSFIFGDKTPAIRLNIARLDRDDIKRLVEKLQELKQVGIC